LIAYLLVLVACRVLVTVATAKEGLGIAEGSGGLLGVGEKILGVSKVRRFIIFIVIAKAVGFLLGGRGNWLGGWLGGGKGCWFGSFMGV